MAMNGTNQDETVVNNNPPPYLKLIADCWEHIFDYLSACDVYMMGRTCKRMQQMAGYYFREYFSENLSDLYDFTQFYRAYNDVYQYIVSLDIDKEIENIDFVLDAQLFSSLKYLNLSGCDLTETRMGYFRNVLKNVEKIKLEYCKIHENTYEQLANYCPKLRFLYVYCSKMVDPSFETLFLQNFPSLEHLYYESFEDYKQINELKQFLEKHTKLKQFGSTDDFIWVNRDLLRKINIKLDVLIVHAYNMSSAQFFDFLKQLYELGFYKMWHFQPNKATNFEDLKNAIHLLPILEKFEFHTIKNLSFLTTLKELFLFKDDLPDDAKDLEIMAKSLSKLERLTILYATLDYILPFIRYSKRLRTIRVRILERPHDLDLFALNEERKKLSNSRQVVMYLPESDYLHEKWKAKNLSLSRIELRRSSELLDFTDQIFFTSVEKSID